MLCAGRRFEKRCLKFWLWSCGGYSDIDSLFLLLPCQPALSSLSYRVLAIIIRAHLTGYHYHSITPAAEDGAERCGEERGGGIMPQVPISEEVLAGHVQQRHTY